MAAPGNVQCPAYTTVHCATAAQTAGHASTLVHVCACVHRKAGHGLSSLCFIGAIVLRNWESLKEHSGDSYLVPLALPSPPPALSQHESIASACLLGPS